MLTRIEYSILLFRLCATSALVLGCGLLAANGTGSPGPEDYILSGGAATVHDSGRNAYSLPSANLPMSKRDRFFIGNAFFTKPWVSSPASTTARDGLGPLFITNACQSCHVKDGRGRPPADKNEEFRSVLVRLSLPGSQEADPVYGDQLQNRAIQGVRPEATPSLDYDYIKGEFADGTEYELRKPHLKLENWSRDEPEEGLSTSVRVAPAMIGLGLLEAIPAETLDHFADPDDENADGISGRINHVPQAGVPGLVPGRFGWKAEQPSISQQVASAFNGDMGLTTTLLPDQPCTPAQADCLSRPDGGEPEVSDEIFDSVVFYAHHLGVPARRNAGDPQVLDGEHLFDQAGCTSCHIPRVHTGALERFPELSNQKIHPYTDLLLHDLGEGLADGRPVFQAGGREWRSAPLWGIGLVETVNGHTNFLHDGRARSIMEAILWHGGEAQKSRQAVLEMTRQQRQALLAFLDSL